MSFNGVDAILIKENLLSVIDYNVKSLIISIYNSGKFIVCEIANAKIYYRSLFDRVVSRLF